MGSSWAIAAPAASSASHEVVFVLHHGVERSLAESRAGFHRHVRRHLRFGKQYFAALSDAGNRLQAVRTESSLYVLSDAHLARYGGVGASCGAGDKPRSFVADEALATLHKLVTAPAREKA